MEEGAVKCPTCGSRQDNWRFLDFAPGITGGIGAIISALTFGAVVYGHIFERQSSLHLISASIRNDDISFVIANTGARPALVESAALLCGIGGWEEVDFYPKGATATRLIVLKAGEVTQLGIDTADHDEIVGAAFPEHGFELTSEILSGPLDKTNRICDLVVSVIGSSGSQRRIFAPRSNSFAAMVAIQRYMARVEKHPLMQIWALNGALIGENAQVKQLLVPQALHDYLMQFEAGQGVQNKGSQAVPKLAGKP